MITVSTEWCNEHLEYHLVARDDRHPQFRECVVDLADFVRTHGLVYTKHSGGTFFYRRTKARQEKTPPPCEHPAVTMHLTYYPPTRTQPAETNGRAQCDECGKWMSLDDIPEGATVTEHKERGW